MCVLKPAYAIARHVKASRAQTTRASCDMGWRFLGGTESSRALNMGSLISQPKHDLEGIRSHNPTKLRCLTFSPKNICTREVTWLQYTTDSSSLEELNRTEKKMITITQKLQNLFTLFSGFTKSVVYLHGPWDFSRPRVALFSRGKENSAFERGTS